MTVHVAIIDDDADSRKQIEDLVREVFPKPSIRLFADIRDAYRSLGRVDLIITDLSSVSPIVMGPDGMYGPLCSLLSRHPGATLLVNSAVTYADIVRDEIIDYMPEAEVRVAEFIYHEDALLRELQSFRDELPGG